MRGQVGLRKGGLRSGIEPPSVALGGRGRSGTGEVGVRSRSLSA